MNTPGWIIGDDGNCLILTSFSGYLITPKERTPGTKNRDREMYPVKGVGMALSSFGEEAKVH